MKKVINIICLLWKGKFRNRDYRDEDVLRLKEYIEQYIDRSFKMYCLTNDMNANIPGVEKIELINNWLGWWSKVELFRPDLPCGRTLYLDLDTYIVNDLKPILDTPGDLVMFPSPYKQAPQMTKDGIRIYTYQAGTMLFTPGKLSWVYNRFKKNPDIHMNRYRSEQDMYAVWLPNQAMFKGEWLMKAGQLKHDFMRKQTIIITGNFNGRFRESDVSSFKKI